MGTHDGRVNEELLHVSVATHGLGNALKYTLLAPTGESDIRPMPMPELGRQVAPWAARSHDPEDRLDKPPIVLGRDTTITGLARQELLNAFPLVVTQHFSVHPASAQKSGYDHIPFTVNSPSLSH